LTTGNGPKGSNLPLEIIHRRFRFLTTASQVIAVRIDKTADDYATLKEKEPYQGLEVERDIKYGPAERNLLDVLTPETDSSAQPVLIFIHGARSPLPDLFDRVLTSSAS
jgi:hypothetical protein